MKIQISYLGMISDITGVKKEQINIAVNTSSSSLKRLIEARHDNLFYFMYKLAVNDFFVDDDTLIEENAVIVLLPPFAGG